MKYFLHVFEIVFKFVIWNILKIIEIEIWENLGRETADVKDLKVPQPGPQQVGSNGSTYLTEVHLECPVGVALFRLLPKLFWFLRQPFFEFGPNMDILGLNQNPNSREE